MKKVGMVLVGVLMVMGAAYADPEPNQSNDNATVTSLAYVKGELDGKQPKLGVGKTAGNVAVYTSTAGTLDEKPVYNPSGTYNSAQQAALVEAATVNTGIQTALNGHVTCYQEQGGECWLWQVNTLSGTHLPHGN